MADVHTPRSRSFQGCFTCRARKVKCDETRPTCRVCEKADLDCGGFQARLRWLHYDPDCNEFQGEASVVDVDDGGHGRRFLYTDSQRMDMSLATVSSIKHGIRSLSQALTDWDSESLEIEHHENFERGPFRVFRLGKLAPVCQKSSDSREQHPRTGPMVLHEVAVNIVHRTPQLERLDPDFFWNSMALDNSSFAEADARQNLEYPILRGSIDDPERTQGPVFSPLIQNLSGNAIPTEEFNELSVPTTAQYLLRHYRSNMGNWFSPLQIKRHPWSVLHLPIALSAISELSIWGTTSHARIALFRALLAVSAFTLMDTASTFWQEIGIRNKSVAKSEMKHCLMTELSGPHKAKYKDILVALLSLVSISVASGDHRENRAYLRDAERLICLRGIPKRSKSRKIKILHYIFLFLRVIEESTYIYPNNQKTCWVENNQPNTDTLLFPSIFTLSRLSGEDLNSLCGAQFESELLSIIPNVPSLLMEIYGIPLSLFSLISRATSLANRLESWSLILSSSTEYGVHARQIKSLENEICTWNLEDAIVSEGNGPEPSTETAPVNGKMAQHLTLAIHNALILYFYRRIYDVAPLIMQPYVDKVLEHLEMAEQEKLESNILNTSIIWPAFIAAVEASGEQRRRTALAWLRGNGQRSGWKSFESAAVMAEELWRIQQHEDPGRTWVDLLRGRGTAVVLT